MIIDAGSHTMELIVPDEKLSLAIGKKGQNVRLASQLTGWRIDIHSESKVREMEQRARVSMAAIEGVGAETAEALFKLGWRSAADVANAKPEEHARFVAIQADLRKSILASAERLSNVIARLQRLVNLENQEKKETDLNELLKDVTVVFEPELREGAQIEFDLQPVRPVPCNTQQMSAVISTLR